MRGRLVLMACALLPAGLYAGPGADDPFVGTWSLDPSASHYASRDMPDRMVIVIEAVPGGIHYKSEALRAVHAGAAESTATAEYTAEYDGKLAVVMGNSGIMAPVQLHRRDTRSVTADYVRGFQKVASSLREVSPDGSTMTITTTSKGDDGKEVVNVGVYRRTAHPPIAN